MLKTPHPLAVGLRKLRTERGWSLREAARQSGTPDVVIGSYERGDRVPSIERLDALLGVYGCRLAITALEAADEPVTVTDIAVILRRCATELDEMQQGATP